MCDVTTENTYQPSAGQCRNLRDRVCNQEWTYAVNFGLELPDCDVDFPAESVSCRDKAEGKGSVCVCVCVCVCTCVCVCVKGWSHIPAVLTPATGIKVRSSGQAIKLETIKRSRCPFALLKSRSRWVLSLTPPTPHPPPVGNQRSRLF